MTIKKIIRNKYGKIAKNNSSCGCGASCCSSSATDIAKIVGYDKKELEGLPEGANMGLSCGNPTAIAELKEGETVLDLGSGGGFDTFIAARKVGASGRVIGVDMTQEMINKAQKNIAVFSKTTGLNNVEFRLGEIEKLPVADSSIDVVISNCVINLSEDKPQVWREITRVLKPGGRASVSDLALLQPLPEKIKSSVEALIGCIAGAVLIDETHKMIKDAGLGNIKTTRKNDYIEQSYDTTDPIFSNIKLGDYVTSVNITAYKK